MGNRIGAIAQVGDEKEKNGGRDTYLLCAEKRERERRRREKPREGLGF